MNLNLIKFTLRSSKVDNCSAFNSSMVQVLVTNTYGTSKSCNWWIAFFAAGITLGPWAITPSTSKKQAKFD